jgi:hypothetical protein
MTELTRAPGPFGGVLLHRMRTKVLRYFVAAKVTVHYAIFRNHGPKRLTTTKDGEAIIA